MKRLPDILRRRGMLALSAVGALWILSRAFTGGAERLMTFSARDQIVGIRDGQLFLLRQTRPGGRSGARFEPGRGRAAGPEVAPYLVALPLNGGASRTLAGPADLGNGWGLATLTGNRILYARLVPRSPGPPARPAETRIVEVPLNGGQVRTLPARIPSDAAAIVGRDFYWVEGRPEREQRVRSGSRTVVRRVPDSLVMSMPVDGGPVRRIASGVPSYTTFRVAGDYLFWTTEADRATGRRGLCYYRRGAEGPRVLDTYPGGQPPLIHGGRFYWMAGPPLVPTFRPEPVSTAPGLMSTLPDGSDFRVLVDLERQPDLVPPAQVVGFSGRHLYCIFSRRRRGRPSDGHPTVPVLCRVLPDHPDAVQVLKTLPPDTAPGGLDHQYCYLVTTEQFENWLDWSPRGLYRRIRRVLYRVRLPD